MKILNYTIPQCSVFTSTLTIGGFLSQEQYEIFDSVKDTEDGELVRVNTLTLFKEAIEKEFAMKDKEIELLKKEIDLLKKKTE